MCISSFIQECIVDNLSTKEAILAKFPQDFHPDISSLIAKIVSKNFEQWRADSMGSLTPKLVDFDWRLDMMSSSDRLTRMSVPSVLINMQVEQRSKNIAEIPEVESVQFEMGKESL